MNKLMKFPLYAMVGLMSLGFTACSDDDDNNSGINDEQELELKAVAEQYLKGTVYPTYQILSDGTEELANKLAELKTKVKDNTATDADIKEVCDIFLESRAAYETSEAFLYGAATDYGIDPHIDSWPLNVNELKTQLNNDQLFDKMDNDEDGSYAASLSPSLLGFHGIEYVLFRNGNPRTAADLQGKDADLNELTGYQEIVYATSIARDLRNNCFQMECAWNKDAAQSHKDVLDALEMGYTVKDRDFTYGEQMLTTNITGYKYASWRNAMDDILVAGCENISTEVGNVKIGTPARGEDINYIESPYSHMSLTDFENNIISIENSYMGGREGMRNESKSLHAYLEKYNPELDDELVAAIAEAKAKIKAIPAPFVDYIQNQNDRTAAMEAIDACMALSNKLIEARDWITKH